MPVPTLPLGSTVEKDPTAAKVYDCNWTGVLGALTINATPVYTITAVDPTEAVPALTVDNEARINSNTGTQARLSGGTPGTLYRVSIRITFGSGPEQTDEQSFFVYVKQL